MFHFPFYTDQFHPAPPPMDLGRRPAAYVFRTGRPMLFTREVFERLAQQGEIELVGAPSPAWLGVPLRTPSKTMGVLVVQHYEDERAYTDRDLEFQASLGCKVAHAIERKQAEEALRASEIRLRAIIETEPECVKLLAPDGTLLEMNPAGLAMIEAESASELIGRSVYDLVCPEYRDGFRAFTESVCKGHRGQMEFELTSLKGTRRWLEIDAVPRASAPESSKNIPKGSSAWRSGGSARTARPSPCG